MTSKPEGAGARACWFVGSSYGGTNNQTPRFLQEGIWENGYQDKYIDAVKSIQVGDRIAIKSSYTRKHDLPLFGGPLLTKVTEGQARINTALAKNQLAYRINGYVTQAGFTPITKTLEEYLRSGDFPSIETEFERAVEHIQTDPHASITASCSIIEATLKFYIESFDDLVMPNKLNVMPLWSVVKSHLALNADAILADDQHKVLKGISSIIDGIGAFRSHIGSAHGRGSNPPSIVVTEVCLVVNAAHTIVVFIMEVLHAKA